MSASSYNKEYHKNWNREYYKKHRAALLDKRKSWKKSHPEAVKALAKIYRLAHPDKIKEWHVAHKDEKRVYNKAYQAEHKEEIRQQKQAYWAANRERFALKAKAWRECNQDRIKSLNIKWRERNKHKKSFSESKRRALKKAASINLKGIREFVTSIKSKTTAICYYCEKRVPTKGIHFDHIVALSKGGSHSADNLCVACYSCNASKKDKPMSSWMKTRVGQQLLNL